ncbi:MAG: RNA 3'-terminal phosphate cyclase, partial [Candidatus Aenigmatarchaeota archaeon]
MIEIDGSRGGGQILRTALTLSSILGKPFEMKNIRGNRDSPGLKAQHLKAVNATSELCGADVEGNRKGSTEVRFVPGDIKHSSLEVEIETAGSISLLFQALQLPAAHAKKTVDIDVTGGATFGKWAPTLPYVENVT